MPSSIRVALCDSSPTLRCGLKVLLGSDESISTVIEASSPKEMLSDHGDAEIDILIADIDSNTPRDLEYLRRLKDARPDIKIIIFSACSDKDMIMCLLELGIQGFHPKQASEEEIITAVHTIQRGGSSLAPKITETLLHHMAEKKQPAASSLSEREEEVMELVARGESNSDIASKLYISVRTVKFHVSSIFAKLQVKNRTEAAALWSH